VFNRLFIQHRDFLDIFLFGDHLSSESPTRLKEKFEKLQVNPATIESRLKDLRQNADYHARAVQAVIDSQLDPVAAGQVNIGGGGQTVFGRALELIQANLHL
jgi:hypothetical protein